MESMDALESTPAGPGAGEAPADVPVTLTPKAAEMVRLTSSGTEASMTALRLARAATGRAKVIKFAGGYHGHVDGLLAESGSGLATQGIPASPGVTAAQAAEVIVVPWNDREAVAAAVAQHPVAAILVEPVAANMGVVPPADGFLAFLREQAHDGPGGGAAGQRVLLTEAAAGHHQQRGQRDREGRERDAHHQAPHRADLDELGPDGAGEPGHVALSSPR